MIIHNLTDVPAPAGTGVKPQEIRIFGRVIPPGKSVEVSDRLDKSRFIGLVDRRLISIDGLPDWYQRRKEAQRAQPAVKEPEPEEEEKKTKRSRRSK